MDDRAAETKVEWREWGQDAFDAADEAGKPVLLALVASWSPECREMDETTYSEPRIAANVNDGFVPVRVDADRHPRVRERYNMGGFPSTVFLTPEGQVLTGATFLGVEGFRGILDSVRKTWDGKGEAAGSVPRALRNAEPPGGELTARVEEHMVEQLLAAYDEEFGGWGTDLKFPMPRTVEFALVRARDQATRTLEAIRTHLYDTYDGGFFRYARNQNWRNARREKLLDDNAAILRAFSHAYRYTGETAYRDPADGTIDYLTTDLWTGEAFAASQGGDEDYFRLESTEREDAAAPTVDETVFADRNGLAIDALLTYAAYTDDDRAVRYAQRARDHVLDALVDGGEVTHYRVGDRADDGADDGTDDETAEEKDDVAAEAGESGLLVDQARVLGGLTTSWQVLGEPGPAEEIADWTVEHLQTDSGALHDGRSEGVGLLDRPLYPLDTAVEAADALLDLALLSGEDRYAEVAREAVEPYAGAAERMGVEVAAYASVVARLLEPTAIEVAPRAGSDLHRAALRLADHETVVVPDAAGVAKQSGADPLDGAARLVVDGEERGRADSPADLEQLLTDRGGV